MSLTYILSLALRLCTPVLLISIGGMFVLKANIFNLALEGFALMGAFAAVAGAHFSGSALTGVLLAAVVTMLLCLLYGVIVLELRVDAVIAAIAFISISSGLTRYLLKPIFGTSGRSSRASCRSRRSTSASLTIWVRSVRSSTIRARSCIWRC